MLSTLLSLEERLLCFFRHSVALDGIVATKKVSKGAGLGKYV
jgi:hypothetical protein